jgi:hypothetical protein
VGSDPDIIKSAAIRAVRTFLQVFLGVYLVGLAGDAADDRTLKALLSLALIEKALAAAVVAVLSAVHRLLDITPIPSLPDRPPGAVEGIAPESPDGRF